jgi:hypothetical protein
LADVERWGIKLMKKQRTHIHRFLYLMLLCVLPASAAHSQELISTAPERLLFADAEPGGDGIEAYLRGFGRYSLSWRLEAEGATELLPASDGLFYYKTQSSWSAITPAGERLNRRVDPELLRHGVAALPSGVAADEHGLRQSRASIHAEQTEWRYTIDTGRALKMNTLQSDSQGSVYFHDDSGAFHGVDNRGNALLHLSLGKVGTSLRCAVTPVGDIGCAHPDIGVFGIQRHANPSELRIYVEGIRQFPADKPFVKEGTTYLPFRYLAESMGASVNWNERTNVVQMRRGGRTIAFDPAGPYARVDGKQVPMEPAVIEREGVVYVPVRFFAEALGAMVIWEGKIRSIQIVTLEG